MTTFVKGPVGGGWAFGRNTYLASTRGNQFASATLAASTVADTTDGSEALKILQPGVVLALITSGGESGKVGPYDTHASDGRETAANIVGINDSFLPLQLEDGDQQVSYLYVGTVTEAKCLEFDNGVQVAMSSTARDAMVTGTSKSVNVTFR